MEFRAATVDWMDKVSIILCERDYSSNCIASIAEPVKFVMKRHEPGTLITDPTIDLSYQEARQLMDALWQAGVRPSEHKSTSGEVRRLEAHLEDMRKLVFKSPNDIGESNQ